MAVTKQSVIVLSKTVSIDSSPEASVRMHYALYYMYTKCSASAASLFEVAEPEVSYKRSSCDVIFVDTFDEWVMGFS